VTENSDIHSKGCNIVSTTYYTAKVSFTNPVYSSMRPVGPSRRPIIRFLAHRHITVISFYEVTWDHRIHVDHSAPPWSWRLPTQRRLTRHLQEGTFSRITTNKAAYVHESRISLWTSMGILSVFYDIRNLITIKKNSSSTVKHWSLIFVCTLLNYSVIPHRRIQCASNTKINRLMLLRDIAAVYCANNKQNINTLCE